MTETSTLAAGTIALLVACGDASVPSNGWGSSVASVPVSTEQEGFGWTEPITTDNFDPIAEKKLGKAETTLAGHSLRQIVTDPTLKIRADARACTECHSWAEKETRVDFCARVPSFVAQPTSKGDGKDPENAKPQVLKNLLSMWRERGCK